MFLLLLDTMTIQHLLLLLRTEQFQDSPSPSIPNTLRHVSCPPYGNTDHACAGTSAPTHYIVMYDENGFTSEQMFGV